MKSIQLIIALLILLLFINYSHGEIILKREITSQKENSNYIQIQQTYFDSDPSAMENEELEYHIED